ncbi:MAG: 2,3-bisphosphoglycerate-independent phosphoglycerate mutase [Christensenellales bacterium]|jgi:2,3-bisphosphoglycerate-independent phosphoglycerate mutase
MSKTLTGLIILDGFGNRSQSKGNAIKIAGVPGICALKKKYPHTVIGASGMSVGLPEGQMGNSEVGHLNIGAGRIVYQELTRITKDIEDGGFFEKQEFIGAMENVKARGTCLHALGLISDGGVHSHLCHLYALLKMAKLRGLKNVYIHCFMDGRDVPPDNGIEYIAQLEARIKEIGIGEIATVMGRYYAMDRDNRFERVEKAYAAMVRGEGLTAESAAQAMQQSYDNGDTDEFVLPTVIIKNGRPIAKIRAGDSVIFFNFRPDRAREITRAFVDEEFKGFSRNFFPLHYVCMTQYDKTIKGVYVAYKPQVIKNTLGEYLSKNGKKQFRIAETEKYAHVTFFFNGGIEKPNEGEDRFLIPSPKVATYDLKPEMSAYEVAAEAVRHIESGLYDVMILNFANPDMVGHTGMLEAAVKALDAVDECVIKVVNAILKTGGEAIITADHGNSEKMLDTDGGPFTAHTVDNVPFILVSERYKHAKLSAGGILADIAPTMLEMMGVSVPGEMTGASLIK